MIFSDKSTSATYDDCSDWMSQSLKAFADLSEIKADEKPRELSPAPDLGLKKRRNILVRRKVPLVLKEEVLILPMRNHLLQSRTGKISFTLVDDNDVGFFTEMIIKNNVLQMADDDVETDEEIYYGAIHSCKTEIEHTCKKLLKHSLNQLVNNRGIDRRVSMP